MISQVRNKNLKYERIPVENIKQLINSLIKIFDDFITLKGFSANTKRHICLYDLMDIIIRVDKRKAYYYCFHGMEINECKEIALYGYWILKLRPFTITDKKYKNSMDANYINESFVVFLIGFILGKLGKVEKTPQTKDSYRKFLEYSFRFRNFTIDSFVVLVESISNETLEKEYDHI